METTICPELKEITERIAGYANVMYHHTYAMTDEAQSEVAYFLAVELPEVLFKLLQTNAIEVRAFIDACNKHFPEEFCRDMNTGFTLYVVDYYARQQKPEFFKPHTPPKKVLDWKAYAGKPVPKGKFTLSSTPDDTEFDPVSIWKRLMK